MASFRAASVSFTYSVFIVVSSLAFRIPRKEISVFFHVSTETPETLTNNKTIQLDQAKHKNPRKAIFYLSVAYGKPTEIHGNNFSTASSVFRKCIFNQAPVLDKTGAGKASLNLPIRTIL